MSYTGRIRYVRDYGYGADLIGAAAGGALLAAALVVGAAAYAAGKIIGIPGKAAAGAIRGAKVRKMESGLESAAENADAIGLELAEAMNEASKACYDEYAETVKRLENSLSRECDFSEFTASCAAARERLYRNISEKTRVLEEEYIGELDRIITKNGNETELNRREAESSIQKIADEEEKKRRSAALAEEILLETESALNGQEQRCGESGFCMKMIAECRKMCDTARSHIMSGMYEAGLADAFAARSALLLRISEMTKKEIENRQRYADVSAMLTAAEEMLQKQERASYTFDRTRDGEPVDADVEDFSIYYRGKYEEYRKTLKAARTRFLMRRDCRDFAREELEDMLLELSGWQDGFVKETALAYERLDNVMLRCETAQLLQEKFENDGYEVIGSGEDVSALDSIVISMEHSVTGERVCLRLNSETDADGHIGMNIDIEDHTKYTGSDADIENARDQAREEICTAITGSNVGRNTRLEQRCTNPGVREK